MTLLLFFNDHTGAPMPVTGGDFALLGVKRPEYVYLGLERDDNDGGTADAVAKFRVTSATPNGVSGARLTDFLAVSGGLVYRNDEDTWDEVSTATVKLASESTFIQSTVHNGERYYTDGANYRRYNPKTQVLSKWESEDDGEMPENCGLIATYRERIVLASGKNWYMSQAGESGNWNYNPPVITSDQAVAGHIAPAGLCPDTITAMIPMGFDYMLFGCDSHIYQLSGDPMKAGEFDLISSTIGVAYGDAWAKDPSGVVYIFAMAGGVYAIANGAPRSISDSVDGQTRSIERRLQSIDLSQYRVNLTWDSIRRGLIVTQIPYSDEILEASKAWFWDQKSNSWWEDEPGSLANQPYAVTVIDGDDPNDRAVLKGCKDGFVRMIADSAANDDGAAIDSSVTLGPVAAGADDELILNRLRAVTAKDQGPVDFKVHTSDTPDPVGPVVATGTFAPGLSLRMPVFKRGAYIWITIGNNQASERWSIESLLGDFDPMGVRSTF